MKLKVGDTICILRIPEDPHKNPGWNRKMDYLIGKLLVIENISPDSGWYRCERWWIHPNWATSTLPLSERINNKIKELDNRWVQQQLMKGNVCVLP